MRLSVLRGTNAGRVLKALDLCAAHLFVPVQFTTLFVRFEHRAWRKTPLKPKSLQTFNWPFRPACPSRKTRRPVSQPDRGAPSSRDDLSPAAWRPFPSSRSKNIVFRLVPPGSASEWSTGNPRTHFSGFSVFSRVFLRTLYILKKVIYILKLPVKRERLLKA